jgi:diketogulonate reductase-like aldo/keto reductase
MNLETTFSLNNGVRIPVLGLGVYQVASGSETEQAVLSALQAGYRLIDTARSYKNEKGVGNAVRASGVPREQVFVTTKLWNLDHGYDSTLRAFDKSLEELGLDYLDLFLIHWPVKGSRLSHWKPLKRTLEIVGYAVPGSRHESWKAMEKILSGGRCRAIGVSNYTIRHLEELFSFSAVIPAVNQVEFTPFCFQKELLDFCRKHNIQLQAYSPLTRGQRLDDPTLVELAAQYRCSVAQLLIRWAIQHGAVTIPKASNPMHIRENAQVFDFSITDADMLTLNSLNENLHLCWDPTNVS